MDATFNDSSQSENDLVVTEWKGFKIVGDNIDKNINPRHQTMMNQTNPYTAFSHLLYKIGLICQITVIFLLLSNQ